MNQGTHILGIDPGLSGAMALLDPEGLVQHVWDMPVLRSLRGGRGSLDLAELNMMLRGIARDRNLFAVLEDVASMPKQGVVSTFTFGKTAGAIEGLLVGNRISYEKIRPTQWKRAMGLSADKDSVIEAASRSWPGAREFWLRKKDHGRAEAALLALYGRRFVKT
jgi:crossover junction endodeoxyribonuclease RuvC